MQSDLLNPRLPVWFQAGLTVAGCAVLAFGSFGLLMAVLGHFNGPLVFGVGAVATAVGSFLAWPRQSERAAGTPHAGDRWPALGMCLVALAFVLWNAAEDGHYVSVDRDPGIYASAGKWLATQGSLEVPAGAEWSSKGSEFRWSSAGMYSESGGRLLEFQFNHFAPALFAEADDIGGDRALFATPALLAGLGLCAVFAVGCRLVRRPWLVLTAVTALAVSLPELAVARDTYSETSAQLLLWFGMWLLLRAYESRRLGVGLIAGLSLAGTLMVRVDALVYLLPLPILAAVAWLASRAGTDRRSLLKLGGAVVAGAVPAILLGTVDAKYRSTGYYTALYTQIHQLRLGAVASVVLALLVGVGWPRLGAVRTWSELRRHRIGVVLAGVAGVGLVLAWSLRPELQHVHGVVNSTVAGRQKAEGLPVDPTRTLDEQSMIWMAWYLGGIALAFAIVGIGILLYRAVRRAAPAILLLLGVAGTGTALYLLMPQITPTQIWATRRYVPAGFPFLLLSAAYAMDAVIDWLPRLQVPPRTYRVLAPLVAVAVLILFPLGVTLPVHNFRSQAGFIGVVDDTCDKIGKTGAVIFVQDDILRLTMPQTIRSYCGVAATQIKQSLSPAELTAVAAKFRAEGRVLWILASTPALVEEASPSVKFDITLIARATNTEQLEETYSRPPQSYRTEQLQIFAARVAS